MRGLRGLRRHDKEEKGKSLCRCCREKLKNEKLQIVANKQTNRPVGEAVATGYTTLNSFGIIMTFYILNLCVNRLNKSFIC